VLALGKLIVIEGLDGSGKATQARLLAERLSNAGLCVNELSFPCYDEDSSFFVRKYLEGAFGKTPDEVNCYAASMFFAADRYISFLRNWGAAYTDGGLFVSDRYTTSNAVYQMAKLEKSEWDSYLEWLTDFEYCRLFIPRPDLVIYLDVEPSLGGRLVMGRYEGDAGKMDIHERDAEFQKRSRSAALYCAKSESWKVVRCGVGDEMRDREEIAEELFELCNNFL